jgi:hypothetical protein
MARRTRLEPHLDLLGKIPDQVLAARTGLSVDAVRTYRYRHGIKLDKAAALTVRANNRSQTQGLWAFRLCLERGDLRIEVVAIGHDIRDVADTNLELLRRRYPGAIVRTIVALAPVL